MVSSQPLVSVCIPCYNGEPYISETVQSVIRQTFTNYELIIADDASTDNSVSVIEKFADPRIKLIRNEQNLGMGGNWNKVVSHSRGKYVKLLCGDDVLYSECLQRQVAVLENPSNAGAVLAICNREVINSQGKIVLRRKMPFGLEMVKGPQLIRTSIRCGSNIIGEPVAGLFRRSVLDQGVRYHFDNPYCIDLAFWADVLRHGDAYFDRSFLAAFRISDSAVSAQIGLRQARAFQSFARNLSKNPIYQISPFDLAAAHCLSFQWCILRNLFLKVRRGRIQQSDKCRSSDLRGSSARNPAAKLESLC
jgi:glycosyltransferase involved in cell wall biosynthesis